MDYKVYENIWEVYILLVEFFVCSLYELIKYNIIIVKDVRNFLEYIEEVICDYYGSCFFNLFIEIYDWMYKNRNLDLLF